MTVADRGEHRAVADRGEHRVVADHGQRDGRPGGRWSSPHLVDDLLHLAAVERAAAHLVTGWVPKVGELDDKLALAAELEGHLARACTLRHHALALVQRDEVRLTVDPGWIEPLRVLDVRGSSAEVVDAVLGGVRSFLQARYQHLLEHLDLMLDARLRETVATSLAVLEADHSPIGTCRSPGRSSAMAVELEAGRRGPAGPRAALDELAWAPIDRVPVPARPADRTRPPVGSRHLRHGSRRDLDHLAGELNDNVMAELSALELLCRCSYEHPDQPWTTHLALARQATDEARHAAIFRRQLEEHGFDESALPQHGANYEYAYEFPECEPGSRRELLWRLLVLCTVLEALAIDKLPPEIGGRDWVDQTDFARALDYIANDELFHTENGLRLTRQLADELGLDPMLERERVHGRFFGRQRDVRLAYLTADPERAAFEIASQEAPDPDGVPYLARTEVELRLRASFTFDECEQVERWGYSRVRHELFDTSPS